MINSKNIVAISYDEDVYHKIGKQFGKKPFYFLTDSDEDVGIFDDGMFYVGDEPFSVSDVVELYENGLL